MIWVGFDDNRDLGLTGGVAVAPIWADFMIRATALPAYHDVKDFPDPEGVQAVMIDPESTGIGDPQLPYDPFRGLRCGLRANAVMRIARRRTPLADPGFPIFLEAASPRRQVGADGQPIAPGVQAGRGAGAPG